MRTVTSLDIVLDRPDARYKPGETVTGEVLLMLNKEKETKGLTFRAKGYASVTVTESTTNHYYSAKRSIIDEQFTIPVSGEDTSGKLLLPPGVYRHRFVIEIPPGAPGTLSKTGGYIVYELKAKLLKPSFWSLNYEVTKPLTVLPVLDLKNASLALMGCWPNKCESHLLQPSYRNLDEEVGWCCRKSGSVSASFGLERTGYVSGEGITVSAVVNKLTCGSLKVKARLVQNIYYKVMTKTAMDRKVVAKQQCSVQLREGDKWCGVALEVPELYPTMVKRIIRIVYSLELKVKFSAGGRKSITIPITIGTESCATDGEPSNAKMRFSVLTASNNQTPGT